MINNTSNKSLAGAVLLASTLSLSSQAMAQDTDTATDALDSTADAIGSAFDGWSGNASLGATSSTGSSKTSNVSGSIRLGKTVNRWEHLVFGSVFKGTSSIIVDVIGPDGEVEEGEDGRPLRTVVKGDNSDRLALGYQPKFYYTPKTYFFGLFDWEQDKPANLDRVTRQVIGVGHRFYSNETGFLSAEIGLGNKTTKQVIGDDIDGGIGYLGLNFLNRLSDTTTFNADMRSDFGSDNTFVEIGVGIAFKLSEKLALKLSHYSRSNSDLDAGDNPISSDSDSVTNINLVIDI